MISLMLFWLITHRNNSEPPQLAVFVLETLQPLFSLLSIIIIIVSIFRLFSPLSFSMVFLLLATICGSLFKFELNSNYWCAQQCFIFFFLFFSLSLLCTTSTSYAPYFINSRSYARCLGCWFINIFAPATITIKWSKSTNANLHIYHYYNYSEIMNCFYEPVWWALPIAHAKCRNVIEYVSEVNT